MKAASTIDNQCLTRDEIAVWSNKKCDWTCEILGLLHAFNASCCRSFLSNRANFRSWILFSKRTSWGDTVDVNILFANFHR